MRGVTGYAIALFYGLTQILIFWIVYRPFLQFHCVTVTVPANVYHRALQQLLLFAGMGAMTIGAADVVKQGPVHPILVECLLHHLLMAPLA
jgi:hypothetical protein